MSSAFTAAMNPADAPREVPASHTGFGRVKKLPRKEVDVDFCLVGPNDGAAFRKEGEDGANEGEEVGVKKDGEMMRRVRAAYLRRWILAGAMRARKGMLHRAAEL